MASERPPEKLPENGVSTPIPLVRYDYLEQNLHFRLVPENQF